MWSNERASYRRKARARLRLIAWLPSTGSFLSIINSIGTRRTSGDHWYARHRQPVSRKRAVNASASSLNPRESPAPKTKFSKRIQRDLGRPVLPRKIFRLGNTPNQWL